MGKISIVRRRLSKRKELETKALTSARKIIPPSEKKENKFYDIAIAPIKQNLPQEITTPSPNPLPVNAPVGVSDAMVDFELTDSQTENVKNVFPIYQAEENRGDNNIAGLEVFKNRDDKIVFRFNVKPSHPFQTLTSEDVCEMLKISRSTLYKTVRDKNIQSFKIGSQLRFLLEDVIQFLESCKMKRTVIN